MNRRSVLLPTACVLGLAFTSATAAQDYVMYEVERLSPLPGNPTDIGLAMVAHNAIYHAEAPHTAAVFYMVTGEFSGQYQWVMGPTTFGQIGARPGDAGHDGDWATKVAANAQLHDTEYWVRVDDLSYTPGNLSAEVRPISVVRRFEVGDVELFQKVQSQVMQVFSSTGSPNPRTMYQRRFARADGWGWAAITSYESYADLDRGGFNFEEAFKARFGEGAWATFQSDAAAAILNRDDVLRELVTGM